MNNEYLVMFNSASYHSAAIFTEKDYEEWEESLAALAKKDWAKDGFYFQDELFCHDEYDTALSLFIDCFAAMPVNDELLETFYFGDSIVQPDFPTTAAIKSIIEEGDRNE
jgi:hypothetical protein